QIAVIRRGRIVAQGSPAQLKHEWLGPALMELRTTAPLNGAFAELGTLVEVVDFGPDWVRYRTPDPAVTNPALLQSLAARNVPVLTLTEVPRSLEDVYLQVVGADE
ncbi:MAG: DUF4162 domain-containing protein, partial [Acidobacteria bacterium]|nr:DUF4162 domain-containing protein [Acidobacteriota bacterium]